MGQQRNQCRLQRQRYLGNQRPEQPDHLRNPDTAQERDSFAHPLEQTARIAHIEWYVHRQECDPVAKLADIAIAPYVHRNDDSDLPPCDLCAMQFGVTAQR